MAKVLFSDLIVGMSGSTAGATYARNRYGSYRRQKVTPVNPDTPAQQAQKAILSAFAQGWRVLTQQQRDAWDGAVNNFIGTNIWGNSKRFTGSVLYTRLNSLLASVGQAAISAPPMPAAVPSPGMGAIVITPGTNVFTVALAPPGAGFTTQIWASPPVSPGVSYVKNLYKQIGVIPGATASPYDFEADYLAVYGIPPIDSKVFIQLVVIQNATGLRSAPNSNYTIVA